VESYQFTKEQLAVIVKIAPLVYPPDVKLYLVPFFLNQKQTVSEVGKKRPIPNNKNSPNPKKPWIDLPKSHSDNVHLDTTPDKSSPPKNLSPSPKLSPSPRLSPSPKFIQTTLDNFIFSPKNPSPPPAVTQTENSKFARSKSATDLTSQKSEPQNVDIVQKPKPNPVIEELNSFTQWYQQKFNLLPAHKMVQEFLFYSSVSSVPTSRITQTIKYILSLHSQPVA
jgi:hypothetical protein